MKRALGIVALFALGIWLEQSVIPFLAPGQMSLRLTTLLAIGLAFHGGRTVGAGIGFTVGIVVSLTSSEPLGIASLSLTLVGWAAGEGATRLTLTRWPARALLAMGLLLLEAATTFGVGWAIFGVTYRCDFPGIFVSALLAPMMLWAAAPVIGRALIAGQGHFTSQRG